MNAVENAITTPIATDVRTTDQLMEAWRRSEPIEFGDPVLAHVSFSYRGVFFPLGFPVSIATNVPEVLAAAKQSCWRFTQQFETDTIQIKVGVTPTDSAKCPGRVILPKTNIQIGSGIPGPIKTMQSNPLAR